MCQVQRLCFFFSSRRRHTRCSRDWSSDVCSSDLEHHHSRGSPRRPRRPGRRRPGDAGRHRDEGEREQGPDPEGRQDPRRLRGGVRGRVHAVREVRREAGALPRQRAARGRRARQGLALGPRAAPARGAARGGRQGARLRDLRVGRADRARRRRARDRLGRQLRTGRGTGAAAAVRAVAQGDRPALARDRRRDLRVHEHAHHHSGALMAGPTRVPDDKTPAAAPEQEEQLPWLEELPPRKIVAELDRYIVGQEVAKKAVAIAVRNRWRRTPAPDDIRDEILPNNIIMIGPTRMGKTEIARRLARLAGAPFPKVEASKFTEVGYVGRDVESMVRELVDVAINIVRTEREDDVYPEAEARAEERLLDLLLPPMPALPQPPTPSPVGEGKGGDRPLFVVSSKGDVTQKAADGDVEAQERRRRTREKLPQQPKAGKP